MEAEEQWRESASTHGSLNFSFSHRPLINHPFRRPMHNNYSCHRTIYFGIWWPTSGKFWCIMHLVRNECQCKLIKTWNCLDIRVHTNPPGPPARKKNISIQFSFNCKSPYSISGHTASAPFQIALYPRHKFKTNEKLYREITEREWERERKRERKRERNKVRAFWVEHTIGWMRSDDDHGWANKQIFRRIVVRTDFPSISRLHNLFSCAKCTPHTQIKTESILFCQQQLKIKRKHTDRYGILRIEFTTQFHFLRRYGVRGDVFPLVMRSSASRSSGSFHSMELWRCT